jgi:transcriptional regulator with XRE-family HTH domain
MANVQTSARQKNVVGPQVRRLRDAAKMSQQQFAEECQRLEWDISRGVVAAIEGQVRCVTDIELLELARVFGVPVEVLLPSPAKRSQRAVRR